MKALKFALSAAVVGAVAAFGAVPEAKAQFYKGKTIKCIIPYSPGGGTDTYYQTFAPHWAKNIPGKPEMVIQHMPGAGGLKANNFVYEKAKPDGFTVLCAPWLSMSQLIGRAGARFKYEEMGLVGGVQPTLVTVVRKDAVSGGIKSSKDIAKAKGIILGGLSAASNLDIRARLALSMIGADYRYVPGFRGGAKIRAAFERGEVHVLSGTMQQYMAVLKANIVDNGLGMPLWYYPNFDKDGNPTSHALPEKLGIPRFDKVFAEVHGKPPSGRDWDAFKWFMSVSTNFGLSGWLPAGSPKEALEALRVGWKKAETDPEFVAASTKRFGAPTKFATLDFAQYTIDTYIKKPNQEMIAYFKDVIAKGEKK